MPRKTRIDMAGLRFGRLVGIAFSHAEGGHAHWLFECDCGNETVANGVNVRRGKTASCGCLHREISAQRLLRHGYRAKRCHGATYRAWLEINSVCVNPESPRFRDFGAIGISVCAQWRSDFETFLIDMGERPAGTILTRKHQAAGFEPGNCQWTTVNSRAERAMEGHARRRTGSDRACSSARGKRRQQKQAFVEAAE